MPFNFCYMSLGFSSAEEGGLRGYAKGLMGKVSLGKGFNGSGRSGITQVFWEVAKEGGREKG